MCRITVILIFNLTQIIEKPSILLFLSNKTYMNIAEIRTLVETDMQRVEDAINIQLKTERDLIYQLDRKSVV